MPPVWGGLRFDYLKVKELNHVRRPLRCLDGRLSWRGSSSSTRMVAAPAYGCESGNRKRALGSPFEDAIARRSWLTAPPATAPHEACSQVL
jgi:hypothetical protein